MNIQLAGRNRALTLLGAIVIFACIILLGAILVKCLLKAVENLPPVPPPAAGHDTNVVARVLTRAEFEAIPVQHVMPAFEFGGEELQALDAEAFLATGTIVIERSTNLVHWTPAWRVRSLDEFNLAADTNGFGAPQCFYRAVLVPE